MWLKYGLIMYFFFIIKLSNPALKVQFVKDHHAR